MTIIIGLTGGIATGKSTVSSMIADFKIPVIDADQIAREVVEIGKKSYHELIRVFGPQILQSNQMIDRKKLGEIIFTDQTKREQLNNIIHPAIRKEMQRKKDYYVNLSVKSVVLDIPLLFESELEEFVDKIIVVYVDESIQLKRLMKRDHLSKKDALKRIDSQMPTSEKIKLADVVIDNSQTREDTLQQIQSTLLHWNAL